MGWRLWMNEWNDMESNCQSERYVTGYLKEVTLNAIHIHSHSHIRRHSLMRQWKELHYHRKKNERPQMTVQKYHKYCLSACPSVSLSNCLSLYSLNCLHWHLYVFLCIPFIKPRGDIRRIDGREMHKYNDIEMTYSHPCMCLFVFVHLPIWHLPGILSCLQNPLQLF